MVDDSAAMTTMHGEGYGFSEEILKLIFLFHLIPNSFSSSLYVDEYT
jgi:hypothetical protein